MAWLRNKSRVKEKRVKMEISLFLRKCSAKFFLLLASNESEAWIGLHDSSSEGRYVWLDGSAIPFSEWLQGEPNGRTSENCIIQSKGTFLSGWADRPCSEKKAFVCEVPVPGNYLCKIKRHDLTRIKCELF